MLGDVEFWWFLIGILWGWGLIAGSQCVCLLQGLVDLEAIADAIKKSGITQVELGLEEFKQVSIQSAIFFLCAFAYLVDIDL